MPRMPIFRRCSSKPADGQTAAIPPWRRRLGMVVAIFCWLYLAFVVGCWITLRLADRWWMATLLMFSPRWFLTLPLGVLVPVAAVFRRRMLFVLLVSACLLLFPVMGLCIPWRTVLPAEKPLLRLRILTCNIHGHRKNPAAVGELIAAVKPDIVVFQGEYTAQYEPLDFPGGGWNVQHERVGRHYGELCIASASRYPIRKVADVLPHDTGVGTGVGVAVCYEVRTPRGPIKFINLHLSTPRQALVTAIEKQFSASMTVEGNIADRRRETEIISRFAEGIDDPLLLAGDFNMTTDSSIYRAHWGGLTDAFSVGGFGFGYTFYTRWARFRIDHILGGAGWRCRSAWVGPDIGSPHRPVIADMELTATLPPGSGR